MFVIKENFSYRSEVKTLANTTEKTAEQCLEYCYGTVTSPRCAEARYYIDEVN